MEDYVFVQFDGLGDGVGGQYFFSQYYLWCEFVIEFGQVVVEYVYLGVVGGVCGFGWVQGVGSGAGLGSDVYFVVVFVGLCYDVVVGCQQVCVVDCYEVVGQQGVYYVVMGEVVRGLVQCIVGDDGIFFGVMFVFLFVYEMFYDKSLIMKIIGLFCCLYVVDFLGGYVVCWVWYIFCNIDIRVGVYWE